MLIETKSPQEWMQQHLTTAATMKAKFGNAPITKEQFLQTVKESFDTSEGPAPVFLTE